MTDVIYESGFNSNGRFYATSDQMLGMTPTAYRAGGADADIRFAVGECSLGAVLVAASERGVCAILFGEDPAALAEDVQNTFPKARLKGGDPSFEKWGAKVVGFVDARIGLDLPLDVRGTVFQPECGRPCSRFPSAPPPATPKWPR